MAKILVEGGDSMESSQESQYQASLENSVELPSMYSVVFFNDDYTPMNFVVDILVLYFNMIYDDAMSIMLQIHHKGEAKCGVYTKDVAETKAAQVISFAQANQYPLRCDICQI